MPEIVAVVTKAHNKRVASPLSDDVFIKKSKKEKKPAAEGDADMAVIIPIPSMMIFIKGMHQILLRDYELD
jgi:hypothetical protein